MSHSVERVGDDHVVTKIHNGRKLYLCSLLNTGKIDRMPLHTAKMTAERVYLYPEAHDTWIEWPSNVLPMRTVPTAQHSTTAAALHRDSLARSPFRALA